MMTDLFKRPEKGQGLVEYALILVLVAVVVIAILLFLGPAVGEVFSQVTDALGMDNSGVIASAVFDSRNSNTVKIKVTLESGVTSDVTAQIGGNPPKTETACSGTCQITLTGSNGVTASAGQVKVTAAEEGFVTVSYPSD